MSKLDHYFNFMLVTSAYKYKTLLPDSFAPNFFVSRCTGASNRKLNTKQSVSAIRFSLEQPLSTWLNGDSSVDTASDWKTKRNTDAGSCPRCDEGFSPGVNFHCRLLRCPYSPRVQSHTSTSVRTLKIANIGSHTIVWTHENTPHTDRNGKRCSCGCCALPR